MRDRQQSINNLIIIYNIQINWNDASPGVEQGPTGRRREEMVKLGSEPCSRKDREQSGRQVIPPSHRRRGATAGFGQNRHHRSDPASRF